MRAPQTIPIRVRWLAKTSALNIYMPIHGMVITAPAPTTPDYDMHYGLELGVVLSGRMRRYHRGWQMDAETGNVWYCGIWEPHGWEIAEAPCSHLVINIVPEVLAHPEPLVSDHCNWLTPFMVPPDRRPFASGAKRQQVLAIANQFPTAREIETTVSERVRARLLVFELLLLLMEGWDGPHERRPPTDAYECVSTALQLLLENPLGTTPAKAARLCGMSRNPFDRAFKALMGIPFGKFSLRYRLVEAATQLVRTDDTVAKVAKDWGFTDDSHLHHIFKQHFSCSPTDYRSSQRTTRTWR